MFVVRKCVFPAALATENKNEIIKTPKNDLTDCAMVLPVSTCMFDAKTITDAFKHVTELFFILFVY